MKPGNSRNPARDYCMLLLMFRHGLRVNELYALKRSDISVDSKEFDVNRLKGCDSGPHEFYSGESQAVKVWLAEGAKMEPPQACVTLRIVWHNFLRGFWHIGAHLNSTDQKAFAAGDQLFSYSLQSVGSKIQSI